MGAVSEPAHLTRTRSAYDTVAGDYAVLLPDLAVEAAEDVALIDDFAARCSAGPPGPVGDVGCGAGRVSAHLSGAGLDVRGFDLSPQMVEVARRAHPHLRFEVAAMQALPIGAGALAGALCWYSLIHTPPEGLGEVAGELARVVRAGGHLLAAFQAGGGQEVGRSSAYGHPVALTSVRHDPTHVRDVLAGAGFEVGTPSLRPARGHERSPQAFITAVRSADLAHRAGQVQALHGSRAHREVDVAAAAAGHRLDHQGQGGGQQHR